jgi:hypothetical protein
VYGGVEVKLQHSWPQQCMRWSASCSSRFTLKEEACDTHWIGGWLGLIAGLVVTEQRRTYCSCQELNPGQPPVVCHCIDWAILAVLTGFYWWWLCEVFGSRIVIRLELCSDTGDVRVFIFVVTPSIRLATPRMSKHFLKWPVNISFLWPCLLWGWSSKRSPSHIITAQM